MVITRLSPPDGTVAIFFSCGSVSLFLSNTAVIRVSQQPCVLSLL